jgi:hypothetical protein
MRQPVRRMSWHLEQPSHFSLANQGLPELSVCLALCRVLEGVDVLGHRPSLYGLKPEDE